MITMQDRIYYMYKVFQVLVTLAGLLLCVVQAFIIYKNAIKLKVMFIIILFHNNNVFASYLLTPGNLTALFAIIGIEN